MFEYQTAISELTGAAGLQRVGLRGPERRRLGRLPGQARQRQGPRSSSRAGLHPHSRETLATYAHGFGAEVVEVPLRDGVTDPDAWAAAIDGDTERGLLRRSPTSSAPSRTPRRWPPRPRTRRRVVVGQVRPAPARRSSSRPASAASTSPSARASRSATAWTSAARRSASSPPPRPTCAACRAASPARRPTSTAAAASC